MTPHRRPALTCLMAGCLLAAASAGTTAAAAEPTLQPVVVRAVARFDLDRATLRPADRAALLGEVGRMQNVTWQSISATGYTDSTGPAQRNERLAARRAAAVKAYLVDKGIDAAMVATDARAAAAPVASNANPRGRALNRRTEVEFRGVRAQ